MAAYMKKDLVGSHQKKARATDNVLRSFQKRMKLDGARTMERRFPRDNPKPFGDIFRGMKRPPSPGAFDLGRDVMQMPPRQPPRGFPGMGDHQAPPWQTQQPGFYESDQMGGGAGPDGGAFPEQEAQHPRRPPPGMFGGGMGGQADLPPGIQMGMSGGDPEGLNPAIMKLMQELMGGRRPQRPRWEGRMPQGFGRGAPPNAY